MHFFHIFVMFWAAIVAAADETSGSASSSSSVSPTLVWVTGTNSLGVTQTSQSAYSQKFTSFYSSISSVPSGAADLGSISGSIGNIRKYTRTTINGAEGQQTSHALLQVFPLITAFLGLFWL